MTTSTPTTAITLSAPTDLAVRPQPAAENPALVYLASLAPGSRRTMAHALDTIAGLASDGQADHVTFPWGRLRFAHTQAIRSRLAAAYSAKTANKMLAALRQVLRNAWRLGQMTAEEYQRAVDLAGVKGEGVSQAEKGLAIPA